MTSHERVLKAIKFDGPDRVPIMHAVLPAAWYKYGESLHRILSRYPRDIPLDKGGSISKRPAAAGYQDSSYLEKMYGLEDDFAYLGPRSFLYGPPGEAGQSQDEWGCVWQKLDPGIVGQVIRHPLDDWDSWSSYRFPDPLAYWRFDEVEIEKTVHMARERGKYIIAYAGNLFELMQWLRGYENLLIDIATAPDRVQAMAEKIVDYLLKTIHKWQQFKVDAIAFNDDWGTQSQLMIHPRLWRKIFKPYYAQLFEAVHQEDMHVHFHTDGYTLDIIPDLMELGVDVLNPQFSAMDLEDLARIVAGKVCLRTDIDRQYILPRATPEEVRAYIKKIFQTFGIEGGGLIAHGEINSDAQLANVEAMYEAFEEFGRYSHC